MDNTPSSAAPVHHEAPAAPTHFDAKDVADNKVLAALSYIGILFLVPLLAKKESKFAQEHAKQGLIICVAGIALHIILIIPVLGWIVYPIGMLALLVVDVIALVKCLSGEFWEVPLIGKYRKQVKF